METIVIGRVFNLWRTLWLQAQSLHFRAYRLIGFRDGLGFGV